MPDWPTFIIKEDLAPGDQAPHPNLPEGIELLRVESSRDPLFEEAYSLLNKQFGAANEMESRKVISRCLEWRAESPDKDGFAMRYEMLVLKVGDAVAAVRDHSVIVSRGEVTVHLSHVLVLPEWRRRGLASLLRTLPVTCAHRVAAEAGVPEAPVSLFCEMDPLDLTVPANRIRRVSYEKAGFLAIPPQHGYMQPDFRSPALIDADPQGPCPVPLDLLFRRVGREDEQEISGKEVLGHVERIYRMYGRNFHPDHMTPCRRWFEGFRITCPDSFPLLPPTEAN